MTFYCIQNSLSPQILGHYPQVKDIQYYCSVWDEPKFIEHFHFQNINFEPITANAILYSSSHPTDLISVTGMGFTKKLLVSERLKRIIEHSRKTGLQFFKSPIIHKDKKIEDYWILNMYEVNMEFIDFKNSEIYKTENVFNKIELLSIGSIEEFNKKALEIDRQGYPMGILIENFKLIKDINSDFFVLLNVKGGVKYIVSEKLKIEIEQAGCTGIEFQPAHLSYDEWVVRGGERDRIYGKP